jgi:transcriptional regulator with XRE-family HTH domain
MRSDTIEHVNAPALLHRARRRSGLSLRQLAGRARTSHSALVAYEAGRHVPTVATLDRILRGAGVELEVATVASIGGADRAARGDELVEVLELAAQFPARHAPALEYPRFGPS